jgi:hypothetical protein
MGNKPLTWQQVICVLLVFAILAFAILGFGANIEKNVRQIGYIGLTASTLLCLAMLWWHVKSVTRPDVHPDFLATTFDPRELRQVGDAHLVIRGMQVGANLHFELFVQNVKDGVGMFWMFFEPSSVLRNFHVALEVPGAGVARAVGTIPLPPIARESQLKIYIHGKFDAPGNRIRFARRNAIVKKVSTGMTVGLLMLGHIHTGGGTIMRIPIAPVPPNLPPPLAAGWNAEVLWEAGDNPDPVAFALSLQHPQPAA